MSHFSDARGRPLEPGGDVFGDAWEPFVGRGAPDGDFSEEIRLHYPAREVAFEEGHPTGFNRTRGRASVKPWDDWLDFQSPEEFLTFTRKRDR